ncbi:hypothetical protein [Tenuifilum sp.]|uniref:hypothetical protein n=1 Tax=Tenuifilum sp. TaxID=2760880 RepID=UPI002C2B083C|nr:hypothetical protein [Tenuifilum sp.]
MKKIVFYLMVAGMLSMVACKSAPKQEEQPAQEEQIEQVDTNATVEAQPDTVPAAQ